MASLGELRVRRDPDVEAQRDSGGKGTVTLVLSSIKR